MEDDDGRSKEIKRLQGKGGSKKNPSLASKNKPSEVASHPRASGSEKFYLLDSIKSQHQKHGQEISINQSLTKQGNKRNLSLWAAFIISL